MTNLFQLGNFLLASGTTSDYKIECDALTDDDWETLAYLLTQRVHPFTDVVGVPSGGTRLAKAMSKYASAYKRYSRLETILIVDDVWTTGKSMIRYSEESVIPRYMGNIKSIFGAVVFARGETPQWVTPLFEMRQALRDLNE